MTLDIQMYPQKIGLSVEIIIYPIIALMLGLFTTPAILQAIIDALPNGVLWRWLLLALPDSLLCTKAAEKPLALGLPVDSTGVPMFVTGGAVCQRVYGLEWASDVDLWTTESARALIVLPEGSFIDLVEHKRKEAERCIESFDLSIVQQGYYEPSKIAYSTPLASYSVQCRKIIAIPTRQCIEYTGEQDERGKRIKREVNIWYYIEKHTRLHRAGAYHTCQECEEDPSTGHEPFQPWRKRMREYTSRFPDFPVIYCREPGDEDGVHCVFLNAPVALDLR